MKVNIEVDYNQLGPQLKACFLNSLTKDVILGVAIIVLCMTALFGTWVDFSAAGIPLPENIRHYTRFPTIEFSVTVLSLSVFGGFLIIILKKCKVKPRYLVFRPCFWYSAISIGCALSAFMWITLVGIFKPLFSYGYMCTIAAAAVAAFGCITDQNKLCCFSIPFLTHALNQQWFKKKKQQLLPDTQTPQITTIEHKLDSSTELENVKSLEAPVKSEQVTSNQPQEISPKSELSGTVFAYPFEEHDAVLGELVYPQKEEVRQ